MGRYVVSLLAVGLLTIGGLGMVLGVIGQNGSGPQPDGIALAAVMFAVGAALMVAYRRANRTEDS